MNAKRIFIMDVSLNLIWLAVFYGLAVMPAVIFLEARLDVLFLISFGISFSFFFIRRKVRPIIPMLLLHLIFPIGVYLLSPDYHYLALYMGLTLLLGAFSLQQRHSPSQTFTSGFTYGTPLVFIVLAIFAGSQGYGDWPMSAAIVIFACVGSKLHMRAAQVNESLEIITQTSTQPVKRILAFDYKAGVVLGLAMVGLVVFLYVFVTRPVLTAISGITLDIEPGAPQRGSPFLPNMAPAAFDPAGLMGDLEPREPALIWRILSMLLTVIMPPAILVGIVIGLFRVIREIYRRLGIKRGQSQELNTGFEDVKEFIHTPKPKRPWFFGRRNEHKLRRLFRETVSRHMKKGVPIYKADAPGEMAEKILAEDIRSLADEYAAVRYK